MEGREASRKAKGDERGRKVREEGQEGEHARKSGEKRQNTKRGGAPGEIFFACGGPKRKSQCFFGIAIGVIVWVCLDFFSL